MWKHPEYSSSSIWMGWSYGPDNLQSHSLVQRLPFLKTPFVQYAYAHQIHTDEIFFVEQEGMQGKCDALYTNTKGIALVVQTADCVPVFLVGDREIAVVHAGWKGIALDIVGKAIATLSHVHTAIIGPCIGVQSYQVGEEVVDAIVKTGIDPAVFVDRTLSHKPHVHVAQAVRAQIQRRDITHIELPNFCSYTDSNWASYRRNPANTGRILSVIGLL